LISRNIFSIENQMQVIPLARNPREKNKKIKKEKKQKKTQKEKKKMSPFCNLYPITAMQFMFGKLFPEIMLLFVVRVVFTCLWFMLNGLERFCHFFVGVSTHSPLPSSCLGCGGLRCSHIFIICCVFYCFHSWFISCPGAFSFSFIFIYFHLLSFIFIYFHFFLFIFISSYFFSFLLISFHFFSFFFISFHFFHFLLFSLLKKLLPI
jgi:hypothetical protein